MKQEEWEASKMINIEFDKSKILTVVTADQAKVGQKGWFSNILMGLETKIKSNSPKGVISEIYTEGVPYRFVDENTIAWNLFYPAPEPTYAERQAEWVKENNVRFGTKVRFTKDFKIVEDGSRCCEHRDVKGKEGVVSSIHYEVIYVEGQFGIWACPFTALEVIKEPTYRPYNNDELNDLVGEVLTNKKSGRKKLVTGKPTASQGVNLDGSYITAKDLLSSFYRNTNEPCGVREKLSFSSTISKGGSMKYILASLMGKTKVFSENTEIRHIRDWAVINDNLLTDVQLIEINDIKNLDIKKLIEFVGQPCAFDE